MLRFFKIGFIMRWLSFDKVLLSMIDYARKFEEPNCQVWNGAREMITVYRMGLRFESWEEMSNVQVDDLQDAIEMAIMSEKFIKVLGSDNQVKEAANS